MVGEKKGDGKFSPFLVYIIRLNKFKKFRIVRLVADRIEY